jgi:demethylmenaquinone methyltransferase/2-methoxy-6-polyprenyl-1,4-benzoquinol methylase
MPEAHAIKSMFNNISGSYDILNDLLSLGVHRVWKKNLVNEMTSNQPENILDCATGTGDIAIMMKKKHHQAKISGVDFSENMLSVAQKKTNEITWRVQDVMNMDFLDNQFNATSISYGIRNVEDHKLALSEMARVTSDTICVLEFGQPQNPIFKFIYFAIMKYFMPIMGRIFNKQAAYKYLVDSSMKFPCAEEFCSDMKKATGFKNVTYKPFFGGVTYLYIARNN